MDNELKTLKVFSKKMDSVIDILNINDKFTPIIEGAWMNDSWSNTRGLGWADHGWSNARDSWLDNGWNNARGTSWKDNGWNNYRGDSWMDNGWNNYRGIWNNSYETPNNDSGCFITSAAVSHMGLKDDCEELTILRKYRDELIKEDPKFKKIVLEYYQVAPKIVAKINEDKDKDQILGSIYHKLVIPVTNYLKNGQINEAKEYYINMYSELKEKYLLNKD